MKQRKTIELRLNDEKLRLINVGDEITFINTEDNRKTLKAEIVNIYKFKSFEELYADLSLLKCGYTKEDVKTASPEDMLAYYSAKKDYLIYRELAGGKGYADMVFVPRNNVSKPAIVVELKWNKSVSAAIEQIKEKQYVQSLKGYSGEVVLVGINYAVGKEDNGGFKKHKCGIERIRKLEA